MSPSAARNGTVLVVVALLLFALIGILGLVIDIGRLHYIHRQLQNAADAAALAGVNQVRDHDPPCVPFDKWTNIKKAVVETLANSQTVSYTHLTLPTIYSV